MSAQPARHLALVDTDTGEVVESRELGELQEALKKAKADLKNAERDLRGKRSVIARMEADRVSERLEHPQRDLIRGILKYWHQMCRPDDWNGRRRIVSDSPDRFDAVAALVEMERIVRDESVKGKRRREWVYEREHFVAAVQGAVFDPYTPILRNGKPDPQNDALQVFGKVEKFDKFVKKCPYEVVPLLPARARPGVSELDVTGRNTHTPGQVPTTVRLPSGLGTSGGFEWSTSPCGIAPAWLLGARCSSTPA